MKRVNKIKSHERFSYVDKISKWTSSTCCNKLCIGGHITNIFPVFLVYIKSIDVKKHSHVGIGKLKKMGTIFSFFTKMSYVLLMEIFMIKILANV